MSEITQKKKAGRPLGKKTTVQVQLVELLNVLRPEAMVTVGARYADSLDIKNTKQD